MNVFALLLSLAALTPDPMVTNLFDVPPQYQHETVVTVHTVDTQGEMNFVCGTAPRGYYTIACGKEKVVYMRNPCLDPEATNYDSYAHKLCHEIGHAEGWHHINE